MENRYKRIVLAIIAVPLILVFIFILPHFNHLILNLVVVVFSVLGGLEIRRFFEKKDVSLNIIKTIIVSAIFPLYYLLITLNLVSDNLEIGIFVVSLSLILLSEGLLRDNSQIKTVLSRLPAYCLIIVYPGFLMSYLIRISLLENSSLLICMFLCMVFLNDTFAYFSGMALGGKNRGIFPVSPNKSASGLIGGLLAAGITGFMYYQFFPEIFRDNPIFAVSTGIAIGITSVVGDLIESALKRSANEKDSGNIMAGRGGVLDTIDSILYSAPLYFYIMTMFQ